MVVRRIARHDTTFRATPIELVVAVLTTGALRANRQGRFEREQRLDQDEVNASGIPATDARADIFAADQIRVLSQPFN